MIGAGAAGMMTAGVAGQRGLRVMLIDHRDSPAEKIRISGGGRCNFTNLGASHRQFQGEHPNFCRFALGQYTADDFIGLVRSAGISYHEKHRGQLFCDRSSGDIIELLKSECDRGAVVWRLGEAVDTVSREGDGYRIGIGGQSIATKRLVIATGGLSIPKIGATDFGYRIARQFGLPVVHPEPALVPLEIGAASDTAAAELSGLSIPVEIRSSSNPIRFAEDLLFTHRGLSGPAALQISTYWKRDDSLIVNLLPGRRPEHELLLAKGKGASALGIVSDWLPKRLARHWLTRHAAQQPDRLDEWSDRAVRSFAQTLSAWRVAPTGTEGFKKAEVTRGGVSTEALDPRRLEVRGVPGLYFIGEVVDITGWLGGYNFQWAWSSAVACARSL